MNDFTQLVDLASERLGGAVIYANDDFFAEKENLLKAAPPVWKEHEYTDRGKWMDGWESRRSRVPTFDYCIVRLGLPGIVRGVVVDTAFFRGNFPDSCSIEGTVAPSHADPARLNDSAEWLEVLSPSKLEGNSENRFVVKSPTAFTHLRFKIFPDGGVARLRMYGEVVPEWSRSGGLSSELDLAAIEHGAQVLTCSDMFFGPKHNLIMPGRAHNMSDGWETRRRRGPGHDWVVVQLGAEGEITRLELDTNHFKGNYPDRASLEGTRSSKRGDAFDPDREAWSVILPETKMQPHTRHFFRDELNGRGPFTHLRLNVFPDGGVSRMRVFGRATEQGRQAAVVERVNALPETVARVELSRCCASSSWVEALLAKRPYQSWEELARVSVQAWNAAGADEWKRAFAAHPPIGASRTVSAWSAQEQGAARSGDPAVLARLNELNAQYESRFGHVFLICATGKSAPEIVASLEERMTHSPDEELRVAAAEHEKITELRLLKLVE